MSGPGNNLGIIVGGGELPLAIAEAARNDGRGVFLLALSGVTDPKDVEPFPHGWVGLGELGRALTLLRDANCTEVTFAGKVSRIDFSTLKLDARGALWLPRVMAAAVKGDDALLRAVLTVFEKEGLRVIGSAEAARDLLAPLGPLGELEPTPEEETDIMHGIRVVLAMGALDIGQSAVICRGLVLAVEAAEGTDAMLARVAALPETIRGTSSERRGVMVKAVKPHQERRIDLPVIAVRTVEMAASGGLAGIAVQGGTTLLVNRRKLADAADRLGLFVYGFAPEDIPRE